MVIIIKLSKSLANFDQRSFFSLMEETLMWICKTCVICCPRDRLVDFGGDEHGARGQVASVIC